MDKEAAWKIAVPMAVSMMDRFGLTHDEMTSVAGFAVMRAARTYRPGKRKYTSHLYGCVMTEAHEYLRELSPKGRPLLPVVSDDTVAKVVICHQPTPYTAVETKDSMNHWISVVPTLFRPTVSLLVEGYSQPEVSRILGMSERGTLHRVREARKYLTAAGLAA